jgi:hypothetical protein
MRKILFLFTLTIILSCNNDKTSTNLKNENINSENLVQINKDKNTIKERFSPPKDYIWIEEKPVSFGYFIENFKLKPYASPILKYDGTPISTQHLHEAVFDIDTGNKDLQQCADAVIRLRAEYLFKTKKFNEIKFHFTSGDLVS